MESRTYLGLGPHGFHRIHYTEWGASRPGPPVVCAHGLTRTGRDFDFLARALEAERRVVCPDFPGRGRSEWLPIGADYAYPVYLADLGALIARLDVEAVDWVGTSMGGLVGMMLAAQPGSPIRRLVLNDIGPWVPAAALARIRDYVGETSPFPSLEALEAYLRRVHAPFGELTDAQWRHLAEHGSRRDRDGRWVLHYDPAIADLLRAAPDTDVNLWPVWDQVRCPVLVLRGAESDLLLPETARLMKERGPRAEVVEIPGVGHAPALMEEGQIRVLRDWLLAA